MARGRPKKQGAREPNGRIQRVAEDQRALEQQHGNLTARCRLMGLPSTNANLRAMRAQMAGCNAGRAILVAVHDPDERTQLFAAVQHMRRVIAMHDASIGAPRRHAVCLRLLAPLDAMETSADAPAYDDRSEADRARAATSALMAMEGWLGWTDSGSASEARRVVIDDHEVRDTIGMLSALRCVSDGLRGNRMTYRRKR